jgi:two-component system response regulator AtoC
VGDDAEEFTGAETHRLAGPAPHAEIGPRWLIVLGPGESRTVELRRGATLRIGRSTECEIVLANPSISRQHAVLRVGDAITIEDLGSANGVSIGGARVPSGAPIAISGGAAVAIGSALLVLYDGPAAPDVPAPPRASREAAAEPPGVAEVPGRVVHAESMVRLYEVAARVARTALNVLVVGETGTGKELLAEEVHRASGRSGALVAINCAALSPQLLESELFGHEKGAFTGADRAKTGLFEAADRGTLFLDEVGEMPAELQAKLLRVVEQRVVKRVGATQGRSVDVRIVAATNRDLEADVARGAFRRDLFFRLKGIVLSIPPLRERREEILPLARHFLAAAAGERAPAISTATASLLEGHAWPGNVRELRQVIEHAIALCDDPEIGPAHLPSDVVAGSAVSEPGSSGLRDDLAAIEKRRIVDALAACDGNQTKAAEMLGMPRRTLVVRIEQYGLPRPRKSR